VSRAVGRRGDGPRGRFGLATIGVPPPGFMCARRSVLPEAGEVAWAGSEGRDV